MSSKKKISEAYNPASKKPKQVPGMEETRSLGDVYKTILLVAQDVTEIKLTMAELNLRTGQLDGRVTELEKSSTSMSSEIAGSFQAYKSLKSDLKKETDQRLDLELRIGARNIRLVGLEDSGDDEDLLSLVFQDFRDCFHCDTIKIEYTDNIFRIGKHLGGKARHILVSFMNLRSKESLMRAARLIGNASYKGKSAFVYPDYPKEVLLMRRSFKGAKDLAKQLSLKSFLSRNCVLTIVFPDGENSTSDPAQALEWLDTFKRGHPMPAVASA